MSKLKLNDIKVESFVTSLSEEEKNRVKAGDKVGDTDIYCLISVKKTYCNCPGITCEYAGCGPAIETISAPCSIGSIWGCDG